jgi:hypothetical protein
MNLFRMIRSLCFALGLISAGLPAWSFADLCPSGNTPSLACVKACARGSALLTQGGKLAGLSAGSCGVRVRAAQQPGLAPVSFVLAAPAGFAAMVQAALPPPFSAVNGGLSARAPPPPGGYLSCDHPLAQAPPTLL